MEQDDSQFDLITALGHLCLGSRLKRLGERLQAGVAQTLAQLGHDVQPAQLPILMALVDGGPATVGALSERVGISQPGISRALAALTDMGLVDAGEPVRDRRQRRVAITPHAKALLATLARQLFPAVDEAVASLCDTGETDLLYALMIIEDRLAQAPLDHRIAMTLARQAGLA